MYVTSVKKGSNGLPLRKTSAIKEYEITVADASIIDTDYADVVDQKLSKIIDAATASAVSRQELMTAQQKTQTAEAVGKQKLTEIEYEQKQEQTKQVVAAETKVKVAEQEKLQNKIAFEATLFKVKERQAVADVSAYEKKTAIVADNALGLRLDTWLKSEQFKWAAFAEFKGNLVPQIQTGGQGGQNALNFMELMGVKAAKDLALDLTPTNKITIANR